MMQAAESSISGIMLIYTWVSKKIEMKNKCLPMLAPKALWVALGKE
jgi:hypothetical protein